MKTNILLVLLSGAVMCCAFEPAPEADSSLPFAINYNLPLVLSDRNHTEKYDFTEYKAERDIVQLKAYKNMTKAKARKMVDDRKFFITSMFKDQVSPYPGVLSSVIGCPENERPKAMEDTVAVRLSFYLPATANLIYGNCNLNDNFYFCLYTMFFCPEKNEFYELKIFTPIQKASFRYKEVIGSIKCKE